MILYLHDQDISTASWRDRSCLGWTIWLQLPFLVPKTNSKAYAERPRIGRNSQFRFGLDFLLKTKSGLDSLIKTYSRARFRTDKDLEPDLPRSALDPPLSAKMADIPNHPYRIPTASIWSTFESKVLTVPIMAMMTLIDVTYFVISFPRYFLYFLYWKISPRLSCFI